MGTASGKHEFLYSSLFPAISIILILTFPRRNCHCLRFKAHKCHWFDNCSVLLILWRCRPRSWIWRDETGLLKLLGVVQCQCEKKRCFLFSISLGNPVLEMNFHVFIGFLLTKTNTSGLNEWENPVCAIHSLSSGLTGWFEKKLGSSDTCSV